MRRRCADRATTEDVSERRLANGPARTEPNRKGFFFFFSSRAPSAEPPAPSPRGRWYSGKKGFTSGASVRLSRRTRGRRRRRRTPNRTNRARDSRVVYRRATSIDRREAFGVWRLAFGVWVFLSERLFVATLGFGCVFRPLRADSSSHVSVTDRLLPRAETLLVAWGSPSVARRRAVRGRVPSKKIF